MTSPALSLVVPGVPPWWKVRRSRVVLDGNIETANRRAVREIRRALPAGWKPLAGPVAARVRLCFPAGRDGGKAERWTTRQPLALEGGRDCLEAAVAAGVLRSEMQAVALAVEVREGPSPWWSLEVAAAPAVPPDMGEARYRDFERRVASIAARKKVTP